MAVALSKKERLQRQARGLEVDRVPSVGGWMLGVRNLAQIAGMPVEQFLRDPMAGTVQANLRLEVDGMVNPVIPQSLEQMRTGLVQEEAFQGVTPEAILALAATYPDTEKEVLAAFNPAAAEHYYRDYFETAFRDWRGIQPVPNFWEIGGHFPLYTEFGYMAFWEACALYPEAVGKIYWARSLHSREKAKILCRLYQEYDLVPLMFCGEDLCNNQGPMVSPKFLRKYYLPTVQMIIQPLVDAGVRLIHHCDGDIRPLVDDFLRIGFSGLQGFQYELGIDPYDLKQRKSQRGEDLLFFTGLSVSRTLPLGTPGDAREEVDYFLDFTDGGKGIFLFTSNVTGVEVPPENIQAAYLHLKTWDPTCTRAPTRRVWPGMESII